MSRQLAIGMTMAMCMVAVLASCKRSSSSNAAPQNPFYVVKWHHERARIPLIEPLEVRLGVGGNDEYTSIIRWNDADNMGEIIQEDVVAFEVALPYVYGKRTEGPQTMMRTPDKEWFVLNTECRRQAGLLTLQDAEPYITRFSSEADMQAWLRQHGITPRPLVDPFAFFQQFRNGQTLHWFPAASATTAPTR